MLAEDQSGSVSSDSDEALEPMSGEAKLQYTLKGVEKRSLDLMRDAARADGMKIGAWVSRRMREAAEASLASREASWDFVRSVQIRERSLERVEGQQSENRIMDPLGEIPKNLEDQLREIRAEVEKLAEMQRILMSGLIAGGVKLK